jgi:cytidine deaminase
MVLLYPAEMELPPDLSAAEQQLLARAEQLLAARHVAGRHEVAAALRTRAGALHVGLHCDGSARRSGICAEGMAIGAAAAAGDLDVETIVAVHYKPAETLRVISPCGVCRELLADYCPDATVLVYSDADGRVERATVRELLPAKTFRRW